MAVVERHFLGFYAPAVHRCALNCARIHVAATCVYFESWVFHYSERQSHQLGKPNYFDTGISYAYDTACFDLNGCYLGVHRCPKLPSCGFQGNLSNLFNYKPPSGDEWLTKARAACHSERFPEPGTIVTCPDFHPYYGKPQHAFNTTPGR